MEAKVDPAICIGCGLCAELCPDVFEMNGDTAEVIVVVVPPDVEDECQQAMTSCPVSAISIE